VGSSALSQPTAWNGLPPFTSVPVYPKAWNNLTRKRDEPSLFKGEIKCLHFGMYNLCEFEMFVSEMFDTY
jgi:hypothetical protein